MATSEDIPQCGKWQPIESAPNGELILYFPPERTRRGDVKFGGMIKVDRFPVYYPRQPTHWQPLPLPPEAES